jgi:hypothetical protein
MGNVPEAHPEPQSVFTLEYQEKLFRLCNIIFTANFYTKFCNNQRMVKTESLILIWETSSSICIANRLIISCRTFFAANFCNICLEFGLLQNKRKYVRDVIHLVCLQVTVVCTFTEVNEKFSKRFFHSKLLEQKRKIFI